MLKVDYTSASGRVRFGFEVETGKAAFEAVATLQELFEEPKCGQCESALIRFSVRNIDGNKYFNLICDSCGAQLDFGQNKDGKGLFVKRTDSEKNPKGKNGWYHYQRSGSSQNRGSSDEVF